MGMMDFDFEGHALMLHSCMYYWLDWGAVYSSHWCPNLGSRLGSSSKLGSFGTIETLPWHVLFTHPVQIQTSARTRRAPIKQRRSQALSRRLPKRALCQWRCCPAPWSAPIRGIRSPAPSCHHLLGIDVSPWKSRGSIWCPKNKPLNGTYHKISNRSAPNLYWKSNL